MRSPHAIIDNKHYQLFVDQAGREYAARRTVRGAYHHAKDAVKSYLVQPKRTLKFPANGIMITAAVIKGRVRMWHQAPGEWKAIASAMYRGPLLKALRRAYPEIAARRFPKWIVLEDNGPT